MSINFNKLSNVISKINSRGASLIKKETNLKISKAIQHRFNIPKTLTTYDMVRVGRKFNPQEHYTDIFTFRDNAGKMCRRYIKEVDGKDIKETFKGFEDLYPWEKDLDNIGDKFIEIPARKVSAYTRSNGKISSIKREVFAVTREENPVLTHFSSTTTPDNINNSRFTNKLRILLEERKNGLKPKFIKNEYTIDKFKTGTFHLDSSQTSSKELTDIAKNTYFLPYISAPNKFTLRMGEACIADQQFTIDPAIVLYKLKSNNAGYFSHNGKVYINLKSANDLLQPRETLVETIGHEVEHAKWDEKVVDYTFSPLNPANSHMKLDKELHDFFTNLYSKKEIEEIKKYKYSIENYITPNDDYNKYKNQYCERVAQNGGKKALKKYIDLSDKINQEFSNKHCHQFYTLPENTDDLQEIFTITGLFSKFN